MKAYPCAYWKLQLRDDVALESSSGLNSATVGQRPDEVFTTGDGRRRVRQANLGVADETVEVDRCKLRFAGPYQTDPWWCWRWPYRCQILPRFVTNGNRRLDRQELMVRTACGSTALIHEARDAGRWSTQWRRAQRSKVTVHSRGAEARQVVAGVGDPGEHDAEIPYARERWYPRR